MGNGAPSRTTVVLILVLAAVLADCGGGGSSDGGSPPAPTGPPGALDATFGIGGIVLTTPSIPAAANGMVLQPDGKIVVAGSIGQGSAKNFYLSRYKPDGTLDAGFGSDGTVTTIFDPVAGSEALAVVLQSDGKIVAVGGSAGSCALARYNPDGTLDSSFGTGGLVQSRSARDGVECADVAIGPDERIVTTVFHAGGFGGLAGSLMRFNPEGSRDSSFGTAGEADLNCGAPGTSKVCRAWRIVLRPDGRLVVAGTHHTDAPFGGFNTLLLAQFDSHGAPDSTFGDIGYAYLDSIHFDSTARGVGLAQDGRVTAVAGNSYFSLSRVVADGSLDPEFGTNGSAKYPAGYLFESNAMSLQTNGKVVVAGGTFITQSDFTTVHSIALIRYDAAGVLDPGFGDAGVVVTPIAGSAFANAAALLPDGRVVVVGNVVLTSGQQGIFVARYFGDAH